MELLGKIHSIESFGTVDGPGVRFVVFFQGCPLRCRYCHNPDTWNMSDAPLQLTAEEILARMTRNLPFYKSGGITATGGEPLVQIDFLTELFSLSKQHGIHTCLDTSGATFRKDNPDLLWKFDKLMELTDLVMLDVKHSNPQGHMALTGAPLSVTVDFLDYLDSIGKSVYIRHVITPGITYDDESLRKLGELLSPYRCIEKIDVLPYHVLGRVKYENLGIPYTLDGTPPLSDKDASYALEIIERARLNK